MSREPAGWDVDSPVQDEVFALSRDRDRLALTNPDSPQPFYPARPDRASLEVLPE